MSQATSSYSINSQKNWFVEDAAKAYGSPVKSYQAEGKALGGEDDLGLWLEDARAYYNNVVNGSVEKPDPAAWNEFTYQLQWAETQRSSMSGSYDPMMGEEFVGSSAQTPVNDFGGERGPNGNFNYDLLQTNIGFTGDNTRNDVFGTDNTLNFEQPSAKTSFEMTMDHGVQVLKVVTTTSKGTMVAFYDSWESAEFKLNVAMADPTKISGLDALPAELQAKIEVTKYDPNKKPEETVSQSSVVGQPVEGEANAYYYVVDSVGEYIDLAPKAGGDETHYIWGESNISLPPDSSIDLTEGEFPGPNGKKFTTKAVITHADGSTDTIYLSEPLVNGNKHNFNAAEGAVTFSGQSFAGGTLPAGFEKLSINGGNQAIDEKYANDTPRDGDVEDGGLLGNIATYNTHETVNLTYNRTDEVSAHHIFAQHFNLNVGNFQNEVKVSQQNDGSYLITVTGPEGTELYVVDGQVLDININGGKVTLDDSVMDDAKIKAPSATETEGGVGNANEILSGLANIANPSNSSEGMKEILEKAGQIFPELLSNYDQNDDGELSVAEMNKAIEENAWPPAVPSQKLWQFLYSIDGSLSNLMDSYLEAHKNKNNALKDELAPQISSQATYLLQAIYGPKGIDVSFSGQSGTKGQDDISFNGKTYDILGDTDGTNYTNAWEIFGMVVPPTETPSVVPTDMWP